MMALFNPYKRIETDTWVYRPTQRNKKTSLKNGVILNKNTACV